MQAAATKLAFLARFQRGGGLWVSRVRPWAAVLKRLLPIFVTSKMLLAQNSIDSLCYLKINTEDHDLTVLRGAECALCRQDTCPAEFEYHSISLYLRVKLSDMIKFLKLLGYSCYSKTTAENY